MITPAVGLRAAYIPSFDFEATVAFYRDITGQDGERVGWREHVFELGATRLSCVRAGGHEHIPRATALTLTVKHLPSAKTVIAAGGKPLDQFSFAVRADEETRIASDPSGNEICFVLAA
jgi:hypothetical protein